MKQSETKWVWMKKTEWGRSEAEECKKIINSNIIFPAVPPRVVSKHQKNALPRQLLFQNARGNNRPKLKCKTSMFRSSFTASWTWADVWFIVDGVKCWSLQLAGIGDIFFPEEMFGFFSVYWHVQFTKPENLPFSFFCALIREKNQTTVF